MQMIQRYGKLILGVFGISTLGVVFASTGSVRSYADDGRQTSSVIVANTASQPVPTTAVGTTQITGGVAITNTPNVNVAGPVTVVPDARRAVTLAAPFKFTATDKAVEIDLVAPGTSQPYQVPAGQRFVLESISFVCVQLTDRSSFIQLQDVAPDGAALLYNLPSVVMRVFTDTQGNEVSEYLSTMQYRA